MRRKGYKGRCQKKTISKCRDVCRTYDEIQFAYVDVLNSRDDVSEIQCNVYLEGLEEGEYTTDFVCRMIDGEILIRECVNRKYLMKPMTVKLLDMSREYWNRRGVKDWGIVIDAEKHADQE